jgi:hypothetical protein
MQLDGIPARTSLLVAILAVVSITVGLGTADSHASRTVARPHDTNARPATPSRKSRGRTSTGKRTSGRSKCVAVTTRRGHGAKAERKHRTATKRCPKKPNKRKGSLSGAQRSSGQGGSPPGSSSGPAPATGKEAPTEVVSPGGSADDGPPRFFSPSSFWNEPVAADAPLDPSSEEIVGTFDAEITHGEETGSTPYTTISTTDYSVPVYTVPAGQPTVPVALKNSTSMPALARAWSEVPLPANAQPAVGTDGFLVLWQPSTDRLWEFWRLVHATEGWYASFGGAMQNVSSNPGVYGPEAWPGAKGGWGASSCSLSLVGGLITLEDLQRGAINHALMLSIPNVRAGVYSSPAQRTDGKSSDPLALPEGAHLRLDPSLNLAALHLPRLTSMIAEAAQRYGILVCLTGGPNVGFYGQDPTPTGTNPYTGPNGYFEGKQPNQLMASFPWKHLQLLKMELHRNGSRRQRRSRR